MNARIEIAKPKPVETKKEHYRVGLALSSGGAKGLSHIGVIIVLRPRANDAHWHDFNHPGKYIVSGPQTAQTQFDEIKAFVTENQPCHEPDLAQNEMVAVA
jgi:hypothetical protein